MGSDISVRCPRPFYVCETFYISSSKNILITARAFEFPVACFQGLAGAAGESGTAGFNGRLVTKHFSLNVSCFKHARSLSLHHSSSAILEGVSVI